MAQRRMFSKSVTNSARFLMMPQTSRLLYYDLGMSADDDGIVEAFTVLRTTGAAEDDLRVLAAKGFVIILNEELVSYITDWKTNNLIRNDRYNSSIYRELLIKVVGGTDGLPDDNQREPQVRLGKDSIGKDRLGEEREAAAPALDEVKQFALENGFHSDPERFYSYYAATGWKRGNDIITDWKACFTAWEAREKTDSKFQDELRRQEDAEKRWNLQYS